VHSWRNLSRFPCSNVLSIETANVQEGGFRSDRVRVFTPDGRIIGIFGEPGSADGQFLQPTSMAFLPNGRLLVRKETTNRIVILSAPLAAPGASLAASPPA
jgi:hypothetical protein